MADSSDDSKIDALEARLKVVESFLSSSFWTAIDHSYSISLPHRNLSCIVCSRKAPWSDWEKITDNCIFGGGLLERYRCPSCDCIFGPQKYLDMEEGLISLDYQLLYTNYKESNSTENEIRTFNSLKPRKDDLYLDWGCGAWSDTITSLRSAGYELWGYEPSAPKTSEFIVANRGGISAKFHGIFSNNVIEHFRDPVAQFKDFHSILADNGKMAHSTACYKELYMFTRFHTLFLLGRSPYILAERTGFKVTDFVEDGEYMNFVFEKQTT